MAAPALNLGPTGTNGDIGNLVTTRDRGNGKQDLLLTSPLSIRINIDNNNSPADQVIFTAGSGSKEKVIAILSENGNLQIAGTLTQNANL